MFFVLLFISLLIGGESVIIPAIYVALTSGQVSLTTLFWATIGSSIISDSAWYGIGRLLTASTLNRVSFIQKQEHIWNRIKNVFVRYRGTIVFASKFIYGVRTAVQLGAGITRMPYLKYMSINISGIIIYTGILIMIGNSAVLSLAQVRDNVILFHVILGAIFLLCIALSIWVSNILKKKLEL